jgi:Mrp family chromosome partitioning ATPase
MTVMEALEKAKRLQREREGASRSGGPHTLVAPGDTGMLRVLDEASSVEAEATSVIGALGRLHVDLDVCQRNRILHSEEQLVRDARAAAAYRMLRGRILQRVRAKNWSCIGIASPGPGEGKTVTTLNLALAVAREKQRPVYLLDLDMRSPRVMEYLGAKPKESLLDYFTGALAAGDVLFETDLEGLIVAGATKSSRDASELLATSRLDELLRVIRRRSPDALIVIDLPPVTSTDEALVVAPRVDALFMVVSEGRTRRDSLERSLDMLGDVTVAGMILNRASESSGSDYYGY